MNTSFFPDIANTFGTTIVSDDPWGSVARGAPHPTLLFFFVGPGGRHFETQPDDVGFEDQGTHKVCKAISFPGRLLHVPRRLFDVMTSSTERANLNI